MGFTPRYLRPHFSDYVTHHPEAPAELKEADVVERIYERSDGLPLHLDRILRALKVGSLDSVLEGRMDGAPLLAGNNDVTQKALVQAVASIAKSKDKRSRRSFRMLKVLSVLRYGETLEALHHYLPTEPFFEDNALELHQLGLLDVIPLQHSAPRMALAKSGLTDQWAPKILKVSRHVRDYVQTLLSDKERKEIVFTGLERFFGRQWREGKLRLRSRS